MDTTIFEVESTLTDRYQTTIPEPVRKALRVEKRDKIHYSLLTDGRVVLSAVKQAESDPVIEKFLSLLAKDIASNPHHTHSVSVDVFNRVQSLVAGVEVNIDAPLSEEDE